jgi:alpha-L-fucosidase
MERRSIAISSQASANFLVFIAMLSTHCFVRYARRVVIAGGLFTLTAAASAVSGSNTERVTIRESALPTPPGPFQPTWESMREHYQTPEWLMDAKFGIFIHWGLYSVPGRGSEWYPRHMYATRGIIDWHRETFGPQASFGYKDFIPLFKAERYEPNQWAALFKKSGARYVVPVAEHHDGFALYDSDLTSWDAKDMGPKRDLIGELAAAVRREGLLFGVSQHRMEHWNFMYPAEGLETDLFDPAYAEFYGPPQKPSEDTEGGQEVFEGRAAPQSEAFLNEWLRRNQELVDKYRPQMFYFDNGVNARALDEVKLKFAAYLYNRAAEWGVAATVATKREAYLAGSIKDYERGRPAGISERFWQCDTSIAHNSWGYIDGLVLRNAGEMIRELIDCVSKNGAYLLNVAPRPDGTIPDDQQLRLLQIGEWLAVNGEAIYGTRPWRVFGEGPTEESVHARTPDRGITNAMLLSYTPQDMRFTTSKPDAHGNYALYVHLFAWPASGEVTITSLAGDPSFIDNVTSVSLLGSTQKLAATMTAEGLTVKLPPWRPSDFVNVIKISGLKSR